MATGRALGPALTEVHAALVLLQAWRAGKPFRLLGRISEGRLWLDMLTVADNVRRGLESVPADALAAAEGPFKALIEGIELTERDLLKTLERHGVKRLDPQGAKFDPNVHQAMFEVEDASVPSGTVLSVMQAGFVIGERVLRPALVGVSKGGPKASIDTTA